MEILYIVGRFVLAAFFLLSGINHFRRWKDMVSFATNKRIPMPQVMVIVSGLMMILGGLSILLWNQLAYGLGLLVLFLVTAAFTMHNFWKQTGETRMIDMRFFMSNIALAAALLLIITIA